MADSVIRKTLDQLQRRLMLIDGASGVVKAILAGFIVLILAVWCDLVLDLPPNVRIAAWCVAGVVLLATAWLLIRITRCNSAPDKIAQRLDDAAVANGQIRAGADLALREHGMKSGAPDLTQGLSVIAVNRAGELSENVSPAKVVPTRSLLRSLAAVGGMGLVVAAIVALMPTVAHTQWLRFTQPFADHPPWTRLKIDVQPGDAEVVYGSGLELSASLSEPSDQRVELVLTTADSKEDVLPMFPESDGNWRSAIARVTQPASYHVRCGRARSATYRVDVLTVPNIEDVVVKITPPDYANEPAFEGDVPETGIAGLPGTQVQFKVKSNRPLAGGTLLFESVDGSEEIAMAVDASDEHAAVATMDVAGSGRVELRVTDAEGRTSSDVFRAAVTLLSDHAPLVRFLSPRSSSFATPKAAIPVVIAAEDDYGVANVQLFRSLNQSRYLPIDLPVADPPQRQQRLGMQLPLAAYGLQPGDEIRLFARVADNHPGAAKASESRVVSIQIIAESEMQKMKRTRDGLREMQSRYEQARRRMESVAAEVQRLQEELNKAPKGSPLSKELQEQLEKLAAKMAMESAGLRKLAKAPLPYELDQKLAPQFEDMADQLAALQAAVKAMTENSELDAEEAARQLEQLAQTLGQKREQFQQNAGELVEVMAAVLPFKQLEAEFVRLYKAQQGLAERMQAIDGRDGEDNPELKVRMRELEEEQLAISNKLQTILETLEANIERLPDDERLDELRVSAQEFAESLKWSGADVEMEGAVVALSEFEGSEAYQQARNAEEILAELISKGGGGGGAQQMGQAASDALPRFSPSMGGAMNQTMQQLLNDAGLGSQPQPPGGQAGGGGGFSARRSTLQNVGLYGNNPTPTAAAQRGGSEQRQASGRGSYADNQQAATGALYDAGSALQAIGSDQSNIPLQFRRRVSRYFQKLADELEDD